MNAARSIGDEPLALSQGARCDLVRLGLRAASRVLALSEPSERALRKLQVLLEEELDEPSFLTAVKGELR